MEMKLTTIHVDDLEKSVRFYENILELNEVKRLSPQPEIDIVFLEDKNGAILELIEKQDQSNQNKPNHSMVSIGFEVANIKATIEKMKNKDIEITRGPVEVSDGVKIAFIKDPNGVDIEFIENSPI